MALPITVVHCMQRTDKLSGVATLCRPRPVLATVRTECLVLKQRWHENVFRFSLSFSNYYCTPNHQCTYLWTGSSFHIFHGLSQFSLLLRCTKISGSLERSHKPIYWIYGSLRYSLMEKLEKERVIRRRDEITRLRVDNARGGAVPPRLDSAETREIDRLPLCRCK